jgi:hypothetical protein
VHHGPSSFSFGSLLRVDNDNGIAAPGHHRDSDQADAGAGAEWRWPDPTIDFLAENWVRFAKHGEVLTRFCYDFRRRTPAPPPFSSMTSMPAALNIYTANSQAYDFSERNWVRFAKHPWSAQSPALDLARMISFTAGTAFCPRR